MDHEHIDEREFELINIVGAKLGSNQRDLSRHMDLSLGSINMLLRRLVAKGFIRINQLDKRKVEYILTPQGFTEKMRKSMKYTLKTISSIALIKDRLKEVLSHLYKEGERNFIVYGKSDLALLVAPVFNDISSDDIKLTYIDQLSIEQLQGTLLVCRENFDASAVDGRKYVHLLEEIASDPKWVQTNLSSV